MAAGQSLIYEKIHIEFNEFNYNLNAHDRDFIGSKSREQRVLDSPGS